MNELAVANSPVSKMILGAQRGNQRKKRFKRMNTLWDLSDSAQYATFAFEQFGMALDPFKELQEVTQLTGNKQILLT